MTNMRLVLREGTVRTLFTTERIASRAVPKKPRLCHCTGSTMTRPSSDVVTAMEQGSPSGVCTFTNHTPPPAPAAPATTESRGFFSGRPLSAPPAAAGAFPFPFPPAAVFTFSFGRGCFLPAADWPARLRAAWELAPFDSGWREDMGGRENTLAPHK